MSEPAGIIYPPPELRGIVDSTAKYVAKNGEKFEEKIKKEHKDKPKFSFLFLNDPFNAYYLNKVREIRAQLLSDLESKPSGDAQTEPQHVADREDDTSQDPQHQPTNNDTQDGIDNPFNDQSKSRLDEQHSAQDNKDSQPPESSSDNVGGPRMRMKLNEYIQEMTMKLEEPPPLNYLASPAPALTQMECDIIKLTSQFIATHGRTFLLELYALIQNQPLDILEQLNKDATSQKHVLDRIKMRAEWNRMLEIEQKKREEAEEKERLLYSQIDWHDFVIKETIDYQPDERGEYPPTTADQVGTRLLLQQRYEEQNMPEEMEIDMDTDN